jgi:hypothetical protein
MRSRLVWTVLFVLSLSVATTVYLLKRGSAQSNSFAFQAQSEHFVIGDYPVYTIKGAPRNEPIYWSATKDGIPMEENRFRGHYTDGYGEARIQEPNWTHNEAGLWVKTVKIGEQSGSFLFGVENTSSGWKCGKGPRRCVDIAKSKGSTLVYVPVFDSETGVLTDFDKVKESALIAHVSWTTNNQRSFYDPTSDEILTSRKYKIIKVLHEPTASCSICGWSQFLPSDITIASDEIGVVTPGGIVDIDGVRVVALGPDLSAANEAILVLLYNPTNPRLTAIAMEGAGLYPVLAYANEGMRKFIAANGTLDYDTKPYHPLMMLKPDQIIPGQGRQNFKMWLDEFLSLFP